MGEVLSGRINKLEGLQGLPVVVAVVSKVRTILLANLVGTEGEMINQSLAGLRSSLGRIFDYKLRENGLVLLHAAALRGNLRIIFVAGLSTCWP